MNKLAQCINIAIKHGRIGAPQAFDISASFPFSYAFSSVSLQEGCLAPDNAIGKRYATGCGRTPNDANFLALIEAIERHSIQYSLTRDNDIVPFLTTYSDSLTIPQQRTCIGSPGYPDNISIGTACGESLNSAGYRAVLEALEHQHLKRMSMGIDKVFKVGLHIDHSLLCLNEWLESQLRKLTITMHFAENGYFVARCICSDFDNARATTGSAASFNQGKAALKAAEEAVLFWRNMILLENNCIDLTSMNSDETNAIKRYRGAIDESEHAYTVSDTDPHMPSTAEPTSLVALMNTLGELSAKDVHLLDLTDSLITAPVVKVHLS